MNEKYYCDCCGIEITEEFYKDWKGFCRMCYINAYVNKSEFPCKNIELVPYPSVTPAFFQGYRLICKLDGKDAKCEECDKEEICLED